MPTTAGVRTDLYGVLGVGASAGDDEIARAFRARAKQLHPDTSDDPDAAANFNELVRAYDVLSNHRTRREYDRERSTPAPTATPGAPGAPAVVAAPTTRWTRRRAWTALIAGALVTVLGVGAALLTWNLHERDARRRARYDPVTALIVGNGNVTFTTATGRSVTTREPEQHGETSSSGPTVNIRYNPANPTDVIVDASTAGRDITLAIVSLKFLIGGPVFVVLGARRLRKPARRPTAAR